MQISKRTWVGVAAVSAITATVAGFGVVSASGTGDEGTLMTPITPCRLVDSRPDTQVGALTERVGAGESAVLAVTGDQGNCTGIPATATAVSIQLTAARFTEASHLTAYPADEKTVPTASHLNWTGDDTPQSNSTIVALSPTGEFKVYNHAGSTDLIVDVLGYHVPGGAATQGLAGAAGPRGPEGPQGPAGPAGPQGPAAAPTFTNPEWGVILRNVIGDGDAELRAGPYTGWGVPKDVPFGDGSLQLTVGDSNSKVAFGNEVDFYGMPLSEVDAVGFHVFTTGENLSGKNQRADDVKGAPSTNAPGITFEVDYNGATAGGYSSLVWVPAGNTTANTWSGYQDATATGEWFYTSGGVGACGMSDDCTFAEALAAAPDATISTFAVTKGRDYPWQGAIDGLRLNDTIYDFEPFGVNEIALAD